MPILVVLVEEPATGAKRTYAFERSPVSIGRQEGSDLRIARGYVSAVHGELTFTATEIWYTDFETTSGSVFDGRRVEAGGKLALRPGSEVVIGGVRLVVSRERPSKPESGPDPFAAMAGVQMRELVEEGTAPFRTDGAAYKAVASRFGSQRAEELAQGSARVVERPQTVGLPQPLPSLAAPLSTAPPAPARPIAGRPSPFAAPPPMADLFAELPADHAPPPATPARPAGSPMNGAAPERIERRQDERREADRRGSDRRQDGPPPAPESFRTGYLVAGRYQVEGLIGAGSLGAVYKATHLGNGRTVALKVLPDSVVPTADDVARFERAVKVAAAVEHENVCSLLDSGHERGLPFVVLEYLRGEALSELVARETLPVVVATDVVLGACAGLLVAHQQCGLVHGDLAPSCIFLTQTTHASLLPKLLDLGITRAWGYSAPEQVGGRTADSSSNQHVLAQIMCECLTGKRPTKEWGEPVRAARPDTPAELEAILMQAMSLEPARRFPSLQAFGEALLPFASAVARAHYKGHFVRVPTAILPADHPLYPAGGTKVLAPHAYNPAASELTGGSSTPAVSPAAHPHREPLPRWFVPAALVAGLGVVTAGAALLFAGGGRPPVVVPMALEPPAVAAASPEPTAPGGGEERAQEAPAARPEPTRADEGAETERPRATATRKRRRGAGARAAEANEAASNGSSPAAPLRTEAPSPSAAEPFLSEAESSLREGRVHAAITAARKAIAAGGGARGHLVLGKIYFNVERWPEAVAEFEETLKLDPTNKTALRGRAEATEKTKKAHLR